MSIFNFHSSHKLKLMSAIIFIATLLSISLRSNIFASCGAASCPHDTQLFQKQEKGLIYLNYTYQSIDQSQAWINNRKANVGEIRSHHDELATRTQIHQFQLAANLTERFSFNVTLPFIEREHQHIHNHRGAALLESWNFSGMGDASLVMRFLLNPAENSRAPKFSILFGGKFPTGKSNARGFSQETNGRLTSAVAETGIQPGSGAYDAIAGIAVQKINSVPMVGELNGEMPVFAEFRSRFTGKGREDYRLGNTFEGQLGAIYPIVKKLGLSTQIQTQYSRKDDKGRTNETIDNTGGVAIFVTPGIHLALTQDLTGYFNIAIPVYRRVNGIQLVSKNDILLGLSYKFSIF